MKIKNLIGLYATSPVVAELKKTISAGNSAKLRLLNIVGSVTPLVMSAVCADDDYLHVAIVQDRERAAYFYNDILRFVSADKVGFLPSSYRRMINADEKDNDSILIRTETLNNLRKSKLKILVSFPEAISERVVNKMSMGNASIDFKCGDKISMTGLENRLSDAKFVRVDFVFEPGQFSVRGSIIDVFSYADDQPLRIDFFGDEVESIRHFDMETQISDDRIDMASIVPDLSCDGSDSVQEDFFSWLSENTVWWMEDALFLRNRIASLRSDNYGAFVLSNEDSFLNYLDKFTVIEWGQDVYFRGKSINLECEPQPIVNKRFDVFADTLVARLENGYKIFICSNNEMQIQRIRDIFKDKSYKIDFEYVEDTIHEGFSDSLLKYCIYTEHQVFDRYHKYRLQTTSLRRGRETMTINELQNLHPGDYVVHIDHGIGRFGGLVKINNNGTEQEAIRLVYKNNSELYVGLHSLHKISKYKGKDGVPPTVNKLGGDAWSRLKQKTKSRVKDIARELIALYAKRKQEKAYAFSKDSYLQEEMEASFMYEETPDQMKAIEAVKSDMERPEVMDRLVCGDVGFGKTEVAMRAAFKAVCDSKQVAVLVPTTVLAYQHYNSFVKRFEGLPCRVEYISRMKKTSEIKQILSDLKDGKVDVIIGTHRLTSKDVVFKDLGLLVIDEEQKFGVGVKEKLKRLKVNVDTITLTATPIPRTLQFSLMGARDMSIIRTPPPNRYPIVTELHRFDEDLIKETVLYEISRNGQVFFIHNRVDTIYDIQGMFSRILPQVTTCVAHGQMDGSSLENVMHDFVRGDYDVLIATTIIESGLDIPNANTIIINQAQNYGLSDLHQLRGRVGRSNKKAFCYLLSPPLDAINPDARRRLKAIEDFSGLGSGFNIAMQDLDIRGAGNILGAEQSGFIAEIGYETYQRILGEAMLELKEEEFKDNPNLVVADQNDDDSWISDCVIDTDFELLIPEDYVENVSERIRLYRLLDDMTDDGGLKNFEAELTDRFGNVPSQVKGLMEVVSIRKLCLKLGIERLLEKNGRMAAYFMSDPNSRFYQSNVFSKILSFVQQQVIKCSMSEKNGKLCIVFMNVRDIYVLSSIIRKLSDFVSKD